MFYTKYRPQKFTEISSPNEVADALMNQVKNSKTGHAYLFIGSRGTGKTTTARILAKAINCPNITSSGDPCAICESCLAIQKGNYLDLIEIDAASNRGIDDIRDLRERIKLAPSYGKAKVYIIDEVHMLTTEAFNALLKTLEEPPIHAVFILCTTEAKKVPDTIKSRCQVFKFKRASISQLVSKLKKIAETEDAQIDTCDLEKIAKASLGGFRDAETMLQQITEGNMSVDSFLTSGELGNISEFVNYLLAQDTGQCLKIINNLIDEGTDSYSWASGLLRYLRDLLFISTDSYKGLIDVPDELFAKMEEQAEKFGPQELVRIIEHFVNAQNDIKMSSIVQLPLELAVVKVTGSYNEHEVPAPAVFAASAQKSNKREPKVATAAEKSTLSDREADIAFSQIEKSWNEVLKAVALKNSSIKALLKASKPLEVKGSSLILEVYYAFHKERLEAEKNRSLIESTLYEIYSTPLIITCIVSDDKSKKLSKNETGELTDYNISVPSSKKANDVGIDIFDGALPF